MELHRYRLRGITAEMRENMIQKSIRELVRYGLATGLVEPEDTIYTANRLLELFGLEELEDADTPITADKSEEAQLTGELESILGDICDYAYEHGLMDYAMKQVREVPGIILYGDAANKSSVISFGIEGIHPFDLGTLLDKMGIAIRTGQLCAEPVMQHYGVQGMARASIAMYNTREEIDVFCEGLRKIEKIFKL